jgi:uncharacterized membrane protein SpoIIM required for sporulation
LPIYSLTVSLATLLICTGLGSFLSDNCFAFLAHRRRIWLVPGAIAVLLIAFILFSQKFITLFFGAPIGLRIALAAAALAPLGLALGVITLLVIFDNGLMIGLVSALAAGRMGPVVTLAAFVPHGVIEIPAMALSASIGLYLGYCILISIFGRRTNVAGEIVDSARMFMVYILPMLFVAAFVESYVTTALVYFLTG